MAWWHDVDQRASIRSGRVVALFKERSHPGSEHGEEPAATLGGYIMLGFIVLFIVAFVIAAVSS